jgi:dodecin
MLDHVYRVTQLVGTSPDGVDAAIKCRHRPSGVDPAGLDWFKVTEIRGHIVD